MAKNSIRDYSATAASNTDVQSVDIDENCAASGINNAIREVMADLKDVSTGAVNLETPAADRLDVDNIRIDGNTISSTDTNGNVTIDPSGTGDVAIASGQINFGAVSNNTESVHLRKSGNSVAGLGVNAQYGVRIAGPSDSSAPVSIGNISASDGTTFTESLRVDGSGLVSIGNTIASSFNSGANNLVVGTGSGSEGITIYGGFESNIFFADGTDTADNLRGRIEYSHLSEGMLFYINNTYAARFDTNTNLLVGRTSDALANFGMTLNPAGHIEITRDNAHLLTLNRRNGDGSLIIFAQDNSTEGNITVAGSTVSLTGGHLARWSRLTSGNRDTALLKGTVMTNLDQMVVWHHEAQEATYYKAGDDLMIAPNTSYKDGDTIPDGKKVGDIKTAAVYASIGDEKTPAVEAYDEDNEQLNCTAISSVEGDPNVAGVFVCWDEDDDFNDMHIAQTGDMVIRIASGTTVARGDLLMSAGDGTAKPQGDDIVRSKTIAKVTSTTVSHTYDDGSYLVPCVLMAC